LSDPAYPAFWRRCYEKLLWPYRWLRYGGALKSDETVVLFPQCASQKSDGGWHVPLHAWVVELETGSLLRRLGHRTLFELLGLSGITDSEKNSPVFTKRLDWFLADREMNKRLLLQIDDQIHPSPRSPPSGHIKYTVDYKGTAAAGSIIEYRLADGGIQQRQPIRVNGQIHLVPPDGISVISDIDDTIKASNVTNKRELVRGIFFDDYKPVPGMPELYQHMLERDVCFHYVSSSPWQIYPSLAPLLKKYYPAGSVSLRHFYIASRSFIAFFRNSRRYKTDAISSLLQRYPQRKFILIGDSGEKDPEIYCEICNRFDGQVKAIMIRQVPVTDNESRHAKDKQGLRWQLLKQSLAQPDCFRVFDAPEELSEFVAAVIDHESTVNR